MTDLVVECCDPRTREREIKDLFARNERTGFDAAFDRAYRQRADKGLRSWIGLVDGEAVMHISVSPMPFKGAGTALTAGVLGDLLVSEGHRDFWAPVRLLRTLIADLKRAGNIDFLFTTTVADAEPVFKAGGFKPYGSLRRFVLPLPLPYLAFSRIRGKVPRARANLNAPEIGPAFDGPWASSTYAHFRPHTDAAYYKTRIPRAEFMDENWLTIQRKNAEPAYAMLSRDNALPEVGLADAFWHPGGLGLGAVAHAAGRWARRKGFKKLTLTTLQESEVAAELLRAGFFARDLRSVLLMQKITTAPPPVEKMFLPGFALSSW